MMQLCLNFSLTTGTWVTEALCRSRASSWEQTPLLEPSTRRWCPTPRRSTCPMLLRHQPNGCVTWGMNAFVYMETKKEFFSFCWTKWQKNVVLKDKTSPRQSHQSNGAAEKAVSTVRGQARTCLAVLRDKIQSLSFEVTTHSPMLRWTIRHAACPGANVNQLLQPWVSGVLLGRETLSDQHLIGTAASVMRNRAFRRLQKNRQDGCQQR